MTITEEAKALRAEITKLRPDKRRRYGDALSQRILGWVERAVAIGLVFVAGHEVTGAHQPNKDTLDLVAPSPRACIPALSLRGCEQCFSAAVSARR